MIETHPFEAFIPAEARFLILGSFAGRQVFQGNADYDASYDWYYGTRRNQFWSILEGVYGMELKNKHAKQELFTRLSIAIADIIYQCERKSGNNLDSNLKVLAYNLEPIAEILDKHRIEKTFFTSRFVEARFKNLFKEKIRGMPSNELIYLPSPSPRFGGMSKDEKIIRYRELLPKL